ncbi:MAG: hypothetical protein ISQ32_01455 [Rickettsiales bacterium]|nr:hypothetical protein [Rickettsiales bacterium]
MKTKLLKTFVIIFIVFGVTYAAGKLAIKFADKKKLQNYISQSIEADVKIKGKLEFRFFPTPHITITHLRINNLRRNLANLSIRAPEAKIFPDFISLLSFDFVVDYVEFKNSQLNLELVGLEKDFKQFSGKLSNRIRFTDSSLLITNQKYKLEKKFEDLTLFIEKNKSQYSVNGSFSSKLNQYKISSNFDHSSDILKMETFLSSDNNRMKMSGEINKSESSFISESKVSGPSIQKFLFKFINRAPVFFPDGSNSEFDLSFNLTLNHEGISADDIKISGPSLNSDAKFILRNDGTGELSFDIFDVQIDDIISHEETTRITQELLKLGQDDQINMTMPESGIFDLYINAKNINIYDHSLHNVAGKMTFDGNDSDNKFKVDLLHSKFNDVKIEGVISSKDDLTQLSSMNGKIVSSGSSLIDIINSFDRNVNLVNNNTLKNYDFEADFVLSEKLFQVTNIKSKFDDTNVNGEIVIDNNDDSKNSNILLNFDSINFDDYIIFDFDKQQRNIFDFVFGSISKDSDNRSLFQKFLWLRNVNSQIKYQFNFDKFISNNITDKNLSVGGKLDYRYFAIDAFEIDSKKNSFNAKFIIDINDVSPIAKLIINGELLNYDFLAYQNDNNDKWSTNYFRIPDFTDLPGYINISLDEFNYKDLNLSNLKFDTKIIDNVLYFDVFKGNIYEIGDFNIAGNFIIAGVPTVNVAYTFKNLKIHSLFKHLFDYEGIQTIINSSGTINCFGQNTYMFFNSLRSDIRIVTRPVTLKNYNIRNVIQYIADISNYEQNLPKYNLDEMLLDGEVVFSPLDLSLKINKGILTVDNISFNTDSSKSIFSGLINLPEQNFAVNNVNLFRSFYRSGDDVNEQMLRFDKKYSGNLYDPEYVLEDNQVEGFVKSLKNHADQVIQRRNKLRQDQIELQKKLDEEFRKKEEERLKKEAEELSNSEDNNIEEFENVSDEQFY